MFRRRQKQVEAATQLAETHFDDNFIARLERLLDVKRFVIGWVFLVSTLVIFVILQTVGLTSFYQKMGPVPGGVYNEGMVGNFSTANPIYATGPVDTSVSRLIFSGLFKYDDKNHLVGDLAESYSVDESGRSYTVRLKDKLVWHDMQKLTSKDVVFTYKLIQNADAKSTLFSSWQGVNIANPDARTVVFTLPSALTAFPHSLTTGILPQHILKDVPATDLRSHSFNTSHPIGSGPFMWDALQLSSGVKPGSGNATISMKAFNAYTGGTPKLEGFVLHSYDDEEQALKAYTSKSIEAIAGFKTVPEQLDDDSSAIVESFPTTSAKMVFFKTNAPILDQSAVRQALVYAADRASIVKDLGYNNRPVRSALLTGMLAYDKKLAQPSYSPKTADKLLDEAGWAKNKKGIREKGGLPLSFQLLAEDTKENGIVVNNLRKTWRAVGVDAQVVMQQATDFQFAVESHSYGALLYGISIGPDPDVYAYWDSTQADIRNANRLNFSEYKSKAADTALEAGRTRQDPVIRTVKYAAFLKAWRDNAPALALYQPNALYISRGSVAGLKIHTLNTDADRYYSVNNWSVKTGLIEK